MSPRTTSYPCALSAAEYWQLHKTNAYVQYCDAIEGNSREVLSKACESGKWSWSCRVVQLQNPIPSKFRSMLGAEEVRVTPACLHA